MVLGRLVVVLLTLVLSSLRALLLVWLVTLKFFLAGVAWTAGSATSRFFVATTLGRVVLLG